MPLGSESKRARLLKTTGGLTLILACLGAYPTLAIPAGGMDNAVGVTRLNFEFGNKSFSQPVNPPPPPKPKPNPLNTIRGYAPVPPKQTVAPSRLEDRIRPNLPKLTVTSPSLVGGLHQAIDPYTYRPPSGSVSTVPSTNRQPAPSSPNLSSTEPSPVRFSDNSSSSGSSNNGGDGNQSSAARNSGSSSNQNPSSGSDNSGSAYSGTPSANDNGQSSIAGPKDGDSYADTTGSDHISPSSDMEFSSEPATASEPAPPPAPVLPPINFAILERRPDFRYHQPALGFLPSNSYSAGQSTLGVGPGMIGDSVRYVPIGEF